MQKFDKIWAPDKDSITWICDTMRSIFDGPVSQQQNVIVCSLEELRDLWNAAWRDATYNGFGGDGQKELSNYLKTKGINI